MYLFNKLLKECLAAGACEFWRKELWAELRPFGGKKYLSRRAQN